MKAASTQAPPLSGAEWDAVDRRESTVGFQFAAKTPNPLNGGIGMTVGGRMAKARERRVLRDAARLHTLAAIAKAPAGRRGRFEVLLERGSAGTLDDDGLRGALKSVRDGIADALGVNDGDTQAIRFFYDQKPAPRGRPSVRVEIRRLP